MSKLLPRYVELSYAVPGEEAQRSRGVLTEASSPTEAAQNATDDLLRECPDAADVTVELQRALTDDQWGRIADALAGGTWTGWPLGRYGES